MMMLEKKEIDKLAKILSEVRYHKDHQKNVCFEERKSRDKM